MESYMRYTYRKVQANRLWINEKCSSCASECVQADNCIDMIQCGTTAAALTQPIRTLSRPDSEEFSIRLITIILWNWHSVKPIYIQIFNIIFGVSSENISIAALKMRRRIPLSMCLLSSREKLCAVIGDTIQMIPIGLWRVYFNFCSCHR